MAEQQDRPLEELEREISCAVCHGIYQQARLLPCSHYYCSECIDSLASRSPARSFNCPECRKEVCLPPDGATELQPAFFVERMKDIYDKIAKVEGKVQALCEQCTDAKSAVGYCRECKEFVCEDCELSHRRLKFFAGHVIRSLEDLKSASAGRVALGEAPLRKCAEHEQTLKLFCFDCNCLVCRDCTIIDHSGHKFEFLNKCSQSRRNALRDSLVPLQKVLDDISKGKTALASEEAKVDRQKEDVCKLIQELFDKLHTILDQRKQELLVKADTLAQEKKDILEAHKTVLHLAQSEVTSLVKLVEKNMTSTTDQDLMSIHKHLQTKVEEEVKRHQQLPLTPESPADITCRLLSPSLMPRHFGCVFDRNTPPRADITPSMTSTELGYPVIMTLVAPTASLNEVYTCLTNSFSSAQPGTVVESELGMFNISVTPQDRGHHSLIIKVKNIEIEGSPIKIFVKYPPSNLGKSKPRAVFELGEPHGIAMNSKQQLLVTTAGYNGRRITVMERDGKKVKSISCDHFRYPSGVAAASDGTLYVTDISAKRLFKLSPEGKLLNTVLNGLEKPFSIKIIQNNLYVVDHDSELVKIFDMDCNYVGNISTKECCKPRDIALGPEGLYVAGEGRISVYRCAPNGEFIRHLDLPSSNKFSEFYGICFDTSGRYIIASDYKYGVYVFSLSGECIGHIGSDRVMTPAGVAVDNDGFLYICSVLMGKVFTY